MLYAIFVNKNISGKLYFRCSSIYNRDGKDKAAAHSYMQVHVDEVTI